MQKQIQIILLVGKEYLEFSPMFLQDLALLKDAFSSNLGGAILAILTGSEVSLSRGRVFFIIGVKVGILRLDISATVL